MGCGGMKMRVAMEHSDYDNQSCSEHFSSLVATSANSKSCMQLIIRIAIIRLTSIIRRKVFVLISFATPNRMEGIRLHNWTNSSSLIIGTPL